MNIVTGAWLDKKNRMGGMVVNGQSLPVDIVEGTWDAANARFREWVGVRCAYDWNMSNPVLIKAATLKTLVKKIEKCEHRLVRYRV